jgi:hypothetical protein
VKRIGLAVALLTLAAFTLVGCAPSGLAASGAWSFACAAGGDCGAFMTIANPADQPETLVAAESQVAARAELHTVVMNPGVGMAMQQVPSIPVPPAGAVDLKPGSFHVMLFGLNKELKAGDSYQLNLKFSSGGEKTVQVQVRERN